MEVSWNGDTPSHHPFLDGIFHYKPTIFGIPIYGNPIMFWGMFYLQYADSCTAIWCRYRSVRPLNTTQMCRFCHGVVWIRLDTTTLLFKTFIPRDLIWKSWAICLWKSWNLSRKWSKTGGFVAPSLHYFLGDGTFIDWKMIKTWR